MQITLREQLPLNAKRAMFTRSNQRAFTLIELVLFIVIVSVALTGILLVMNIVNRNSADPQLRKQALSIAEALLEEVSLAKFTYCDPADANAETAANPAGCADQTNRVEIAGPEAGNVRPFDNVNDYAGVGGYGVPNHILLTDANGQPINVTGTYDATVTITAVPLGSGSTLISSDGTPAGTNVLRITVNVNYGNQNIQLDGYRTRYAPNLIP
jgi:MSHA pilin protein MshD